MVPIILAIVAVLGLVGVIASAYVIARSSALKQSAEAWRENAEAEKARADRYELDVESLKARVGVLERDNAQLRDLATGASAITELRALMIQQHQETRYLITATLPN